MLSNDLKWILKRVAGRDWTRYFEEPCSPSSWALIGVCIAFTELHTQYAQQLVRTAKRKSSAREAHLTGALGHGRFDAGAKMTDKRRGLIVYAAGKLCIGFPPREPFKSPRITFAKCQGF